MDELIIVKASRNLNNSWVTGQYPKKVTFSIKYFLINNEDSEILELEFSEFITNLTSDTFIFEFIYKPVNWLECFDLQGFSQEEYIFLMFLLAVVIISISLLYF